MDVQEMVLMTCGVDGECVVVVPNRVPFAHWQSPERLC